MAKILVIGGAGYVGSAACAWLMDQGHEVWVIDDLSTGYRELVLGSGFLRAKAGDADAITRLTQSIKFDAVMHFAAKSLVSESVADPALYFENNVEQTRVLLETLLNAGIRKFIFSSSCAIFGDPGNRKITENTPKNPVSPYGQTKLEVERLLELLSTTRGLQAISLRYFNAAGAEPGLRVGEWHYPETHLIPNILDAIEAGRPIQLFGNDYPTPDGTCIRDYVHVSDLACAHETALSRLLRLPENSNGHFEAFNLGSGRGYSVREVITTCERVLNQPVKIEPRPRRAGDPPFLVADSSLAIRELGFASYRDGDLERIISSAWDWKRRSPRPIRKAVFLDRDGTINVDPGYLSHPDQMKLMPGAGQALALLKNAGYYLIVVSNQSGVGRGLIREEEMPNIHRRLGDLLAPYGVWIDGYQLCFHRPDENCECRKPKPKMIVDSAYRFGITIEESFMVGDKATDIGAGIAARCKGTALVRTGAGAEAESELAASEMEVTADFIGDSLLEVAQWILEHRNTEG